MTTSDEPTRLAQIIVPAFAGESEGWDADLANGANAKLLAGALAQDDCAIFQLCGNQDLVIGSDYVRGSKFRLYELGYLDNYDIGYYLAMANFSDIAAMGAQPVALLSVIRYPKDMPDEEFEAIIRGIQAGCAQAGARNVGGDIGSAERIILSAAAIGIVEPGAALRRRGAHDGDILCVTGYTGIAGAAQKYFYDLEKGEHSLPAEIEDRLLSAWRRPRARVREGRVLSSSQVVTSCLDSSDGLKAAIETLATASGVGFSVQEYSLPIAPAVEAVCKLRELDVLEVIFGDSVDFQLVFTVSPDKIDDLEKSFTSDGLEFFKIGIATSDPQVILVNRRDELSPLPGEGWRHQI